MKTKTEANLTDGKEPVALMLFSSEIQRVRSYVDEMQTKLMAKIPRKEEDLRVEKEENKAEIVKTKAELESQKTALRNMIQTRPIMNPIRSKSEVSPNKMVNIIGGGVLGSFISLSFVIIIEFWGKVKEKNETNLGYL